MSANLEANVKDKLWPKLVNFALLAAVLPGTLLFVSAGRLDWLMGWVFMTIATIGNVGSRVVAYRIDPEFLHERGRYWRGSGVKSWDKVMVPVIGVLLYSVLVVSALDWRFRWSGALPPLVPWIALAVFVVAEALGVWALIANRFFSSYARIQTEREHRVVSNGPYRFIRHPGYLSGIVMYLAIPLLLDGLWGLVPAVLHMVGFVIRTGLEDRMLLEELPGYVDYSQLVKYRLLPGVW